MAHVGSLFFVFFFLSFALPVLISPMVIGNISISSCLPLSPLLTDSTLFNFNRHFTISPWIRVLPFTHSLSSLFNPLPLLSFLLFFSFCYSLFAHESLPVRADSHLVSLPAHHRAYHEHRRKKTCQRPMRALAYAVDCARRVSTFALTHFFHSLIPFP